MDDHLYSALAKQSVAANMVAEAVGFYVKLLGDQLGEELDVYVWMYGCMDVWMDVWM